MKQLFLIDDTTVNKISYYHLAAFLIALPFDFFYSEIILISFGLHTLIHTRKEKAGKIFSQTSFNTYFHLPAWPAGCFVQPR